MAGVEGTQRRLELDSLRGLAALSVVFCHFMILLPEVFDAGRGAPSLVKIVRDSPLHVLWSGFEAVVFFFVLSGFVLSIPFFKRPPGYKDFVIRRICRIWLPYAVAVAMAMVAFWLFHRPEKVQGLSSWFNGTWKQPLSARAILDHMLLVVSFRNSQYDPVLWSLVVEMRISLIFPFLMWVIVRKGFRAAFALSAIAYIVGRGLNWYTTQRLQWDNDYFLTLMFVYMFVLGAYLASRIDRLTRWFGSLGRPAKLAMLAAGVLAYSSAFTLSQLPAPWGEQAVRFASIFITTGGVAIFIIIGSAAGTTNNWLRKRPLVFLGRVSYSLYLVHAFVLLSLVSLLYGRLPLWAIIAFAAPLAFGLAAMSYYFVEEPSMAIGRRLTSRARAPATILSASAPPEAASAEAVEAGRAGAIPAAPIEAQADSRR